MKTILTTLIWASLFLLTLCFVSSCTKFRVTLPNKTKIEYEKGLMDATAKKVEFYYEAPNVVLWIVVNDPNSSVHPGRLKIKEPYSGVEAGIEAD